MERRPTSGPFTPVLQVLTGLLGALSFGTGVFAVFVTQNGTGTAVLLTFGGVLLVFGLLGNRVESFEVGGSTLRLRAAAAERYALAEESEQRGDTAEAAQLRLEAEALLQAAGPIAADYRSVRGSMRPGRERTRAMEAVMSQARRLAAEQEFEPGQVLRWLQEGSDEERITALAMMQARPELRNFDAALGTVADSHSAFEQYQAMCLVEEMVDDLDAVQRQRLAGVIRAGQRTRLVRDSDRWRLGEAILRRVDAHADAR
ncbi:hypothetical protein ACIP98_06590 [Streptomyces sp. NPDC088354]|uniref:hypothetical protein n=1 Tax=Streptomyces sp. NPDC088354 TaxID=3365856 RepID=UPI0037F686D0